MKEVFYGLIFLAAVLCSCQSRHNSANSAAGQAAVDSVAKSGFPFPDIPVAITSPEERKEWMLTHYWDRFNFTDTALVNNGGITEQGFVNFLALLADGATPENVIRKSFDNWCAAFMADSHAYDVMTSSADSYLYDANSPYYNETLYGYYLEAMLGALPQGDARRTQMKYKLELIRRNNVGDKATDFAYWLPDGTRHKLSATPAAGGRLLLVFYDPECESCHEVLGRMVSDRVLADAVAGGRVSVLAVYTEGDDGVWRSSLNDMPAGWTVATDRLAVKKGSLYDLKAMPSLYLLDGAGRVLMKDAPYEAVSKALDASAGASE